MSALYEKAEAARGPFDIVVANAGAAESAPAHKTTLADWQQDARRQSHRRLRDREAGAGRHGRAQVRHGSSSSPPTAGLKGYAYVAPYVAAKHGVVGLMRALAAETAKTGVTVNAVCPGYVETRHAGRNPSAASSRRPAARPRQARALLAATNPQGRLVQPDEVAAAVLWLCGDSAGSITGQAISISGGETW